nr:hypothetical protein [Massilia sp. JS1662]
MEKTEGIDLRLLGFVVACENDRSFGFGDHRIFRCVKTNQLELN